MSDRSKPVLWHISISHYNEKARWALAYKGVRHSRRAVPGGVHMALALALTRGRHKTFPMLELDGARIGDSTEIIAALERRFPEPPLYPSDETERRRALELEDWFDEQLGPHMRLLAWHELTRDRERLEELVAMQLPGARGRRVAALAATAFVNRRYGVHSEEAAELARGRVLGALDHVERELDADGEYLAGDRFTVADLTAAALLYPLVQPPEGPRLARPPEALQRFREPLRDRRACRWVEEMYRRHRRHRPAAERAAAAAAA